MSAGISYVPSNDDVDSLLGSYINAAGVCTNVRYEVDYDLSVTPVTSTVRYISLVTNLPLTLTPAEIATFSASECGKGAISATIRIASGTGATNAQVNSDGTTFNMNTYLASAGVVAALGGVAVLQGYEFVVEAADNANGASIANRVDFVEPGNASGTGTARAYFLNEGGEANANDSQVEFLRTTPTWTLTCVGNARALLKVTVKRA
jgi:hypothetical protein